MIRSLSFGEEHDWMIRYAGSSVAEIVILLRKDYDAIISRRSVSSERNIGVRKTDRPVQPTRLDLLFFEFALPRSYKGQQVLSTTPFHKKQCRPSEYSLLTKHGCRATILLQLECYGKQGYYKDTAGPAPAVERDNKGYWLFQCYRVNCICNANSGFKRGAERRI